MLTSFGGIQRGARILLSTSRNNQDNKINKTTRFSKKMSNLGINCPHKLSYLEGTDPYDERDRNGIHRPRVP